MKLKIKGFQGFRYFPRGLQKRPKKIQKEIPGRPQCPPGAPREGPGAAQEAPRRPHDGPKSRPRGPKKGATKVTTFVCALLGGPGAPWEPPWSVFGASGVAFWSHFRKIFLSLKRSVATARARGVPSEAPAQNAERGRGARPRSLTRMLC